MAAKFTSWRSQKMSENSTHGRPSEKPINVLLELVGRRWILRVVWELRGGPLTARALRTRCDQAPPGSLQARLVDLRQAGFVEHRSGSGYALTDVGRAFLSAFMSLYFFAEEWKAAENQ